MRTKSKNITELVLLKHSCNLCLDYKFLALFKYILLITYSSTERIGDNFSAKSWSKILFRSVSYKTNKIGIFYSRYTAITPLLCPRTIQNWARITHIILHSSHTCKVHSFTWTASQLLFHSLQCFHFTSAAGAEGRCAHVLKSQAPWNTHTLQNLIQNTK